MSSRLEDFKIQDRTIIVTGATSSLGISICQRLAELGAHVAMIDSDAKKIERIATSIHDQREVNEKFGKAVGIACNFSDPKSVLDALHKSIETFGAVEVYIDCLNTAQSLPFQDETFLTEVDKYWTSHVRPTLQFTQLVLPFLKSRKRGRIIYMIPETAIFGVEGEALIASTRSSLIAVAQVLATENSKDNISINCLRFGLTEEFLLQKIPGAPSLRNAQEVFQKQAPHLSLIDPKDIANFVSFMASPYAQAISGQSILIQKRLPV